MKVRIAGWARPAELRAETRVRHNVRHTSETGLESSAHVRGRARNQGRGHWPVCASIFERVKGKASGNSARAVSSSTWIASGWRWRHWPADGTSPAVLRSE